MPLTAFARPPRTRPLIPLPVSVALVFLAVLIPVLAVAQSRARDERNLRATRAVLDHRDRGILGPHAPTDAVFALCTDAWGEGSSLCGTETGIAISAPPGTAPTTAQSVADRCAAEYSTAFPYDTWTVDIQINRVIVASAMSIPQPPQPSQERFAGPSPYPRRP